MSIIQKLKDKSVLYILKHDEKAGWISGEDCGCKENEVAFIEGCDEHFSLVLNKSELQKLINELQVIHNEL